MVNGLPARKFGCQGLGKKGISNLTTKWRGHYVPICTQTVSTNGQRCVRVVRGGCIKQYSSVSSRYSTPLQSFYDNNQISIQYSVGSSIELPDNKLYQVTYHIKYGI